MSDKELQLKFLLFLAKKSGAKSLKELEKYVENLGEEGLKKAYEEFSQETIKELNKQTQKAEHGAKLNYIKSLKHQCADDEELFYFKRGGLLDCGCRKKMLKGGQTPKLEDNILTKFKKRVDEKVENLKKKLTPKDNTIIVTKKQLEEAKKEAARQKNNDDDDEQVIPGINKGIGKNCGGAKIKVVKKGKKVC